MTADKVTVRGTMEVKGRNAEVKGVHIDSRPSKKQAAFDRAFKSTSTRSTPANRPTPTLKSFSRKTVEKMLKIARDAALKEGHRDGYAAAESDRLHAARAESRHNHHIADGELRPGLNEKGSTTREIDRAIEVMTSRTSRDEPESACHMDEVNKEIDRAIARVGGLADRANQLANSLVGSQPEDGAEGARTAGTDGRVHLALMLLRRLHEVLDRAANEVERFGAL